MIFFRKPAVSWLVVFLGNPGAKYANTRHNAGFMTADAVSKKYGARIDRLKFKALTCICDIGGEKAFLMKSQTFMNLSGDAVRGAQAFYKVPTEHILVVSDDISMPTGKLRIRRSGSAGGHNGLRDIIAKCGGDGFPRVKIGVGIPPEGGDVIDWVLGSFKNKDAADMADAVEKAADAVGVILSEGIEKAMSIFN